MKRLIIILFSLISISQAQVLYQPEEMKILNRFAPPRRDTIGPVLGSDLRVRPQDGALYGWDYVNSYWRKFLRDGDVTSGGTYTGTSPISVDGSNVISMTAAGAATSGYITSSAQTIGGQKSFNAGVVVNSESTGYFSINNSGGNFQFVLAQSGYADYGLFTDGTGGLYTSGANGMAFLSDGVGSPGPFRFGFGTSTIPALEVASGGITMAASGGTSGLTFQSLPGGSDYYAMYARGVTPSSTNYYIGMSNDGGELYLQADNALVLSGTNGITINGGSNSLKFPQTRPGTNGYVPSWNTDGTFDEWIAPGGGGSSQWTTINSNTIEYTGASDHSYALVASPTAGKAAVFAAQSFDGVDTRLQSNGSEAFIGTVSSHPLSIVSGNVVRVEFPLAAAPIFTDFIGSGDRYAGFDATGHLKIMTTPSGSTPAGSNTQIQYNNSGAFGASANFSWNNSSSALSVGDGSAGLILRGVPTLSGYYGIFASGVTPSASNYNIATNAAGNELYIQANAALALSGTNGVTINAGGASYILPTTRPAGNGYSLIGNTDGTTSWSNVSGGGGGFTSPLTTTGDLLSYSSGTHVRIAAGTSGYYLGSNGAGVLPSWKPMPGNPGDVDVVKFTAGNTGAGSGNFAGSMNIFDGEAGYFVIHLTIATSDNSTSYVRETRVPFKKVSGTFSLGTEYEVFVSGMGAYPYVSTYAAANVSNNLGMTYSTNGGNLAWTAVVYKYVSSYGL